VLPWRFALGSASASFLSSLRSPRSGPRKYKWWVSLSSRRCAARLRQGF